MAFAIYVHRANGTEHGYLAETGGVTPWRRNAARWSSLEAANAEIQSRCQLFGWERDTGTRPGVVTAYACAVD